MSAYMDEHPIREPLRRLGKTQAWLSEQVGVTPQAVTDWIARRYSPSWPVAKRVALILDIPVSKILDWHDAAAPEKAP